MAEDPPVTKGAGVVLQVVNNLAMQMLACNVQ